MSLPQNSSRLQLLQARFQQKQLQEKEQKLLQLYDQQQQRAHQVAQRGSAGSNGTSSTTSNNATSQTHLKNRQIFAERNNRQNGSKGIDKSYPLEPLNNHSNNINKTKASQHQFPRSTRSFRIADEIRAARNENSTISSYSTTSTTTTTTTSSSDATAAAAAAAGYFGGSTSRKNSCVSSSSSSAAFATATFAAASAVAAHLPIKILPSGSGSSSSSISAASSNGNNLPCNDSESIVQQQQQQQQQLHNGHHYEINIDEIIDNEAMERNRMLAKFNTTTATVEVQEKRRKSYVGDDTSDGFGRKILHDSTNNKEMKKSTTTGITKNNNVSSNNNNNEKKSFSSDVKNSERLKNMNIGKNQSMTGNNTKKYMETTNGRQSTLMNLTKSASLKVNKLNRFKKKSNNTSNIKRRQVDDKVKKEVTRKLKTGERDKGLSTTTMDPLKSISIIYEIIRNRNNKIDKKNDGRNKQENLYDIYKDKTAINTILLPIGRKALISKIESPIKRKTKIEQKTSSSTNNIKKKNCQVDNIFSKKSSSKKFGSTIQQVKSNTMKEQSKGSSSSSTQETTAIVNSSDTKGSNQTISKSDDHNKITNNWSIIDDTTNRARRRASFEFKRNMFEQMSSSCQDNFLKRHSIQLSFPYFKYVQVIGMTDLTKPDVNSHSKMIDLKKSKATPILSTANKESVRTRKTTARLNTGVKKEGHGRLCLKNIKDGNNQEKKGFEKNTRSWITKINKQKSINQQPKKNTSKLIVKKPTVKIIPTVKTRIFTSTSRKITPPDTSSTNKNKKLQLARDSIELTRVSVKTKCNRKKVRPNLIRSSGNKALISLRVIGIKKNNDDDDKNDNNVKSIENPYFKRNKIINLALLKSQATAKQICKRTKFSFSTIKNVVNADSTMTSKRSGTNTRSQETTSRKNNSGYHQAATKNIDKNHEQSQPIAQKPSSSSFKFLNRIVETSNTAVSSSSSTNRENGYTNMSRKSSLTGNNISTDLAFDEKPITSSTSHSHPRVSSSLSSTSSVATNRSQNSNGSRTTHDKAKSNLSNSQASSSDLTTCKICKRRFTTERIALHEQICAKAAQKKRKQFDALNQRVKGTELESFVTNKPPLKKQSKNNQNKSEHHQQQQQQPKAASSTTSNWRRKHEDFINTIRSAKQIQAHLASGGKLSDLPPPPASDTSDYVKCPHCSRKFCQAAADRHIPKCESMQHNKIASRAPYKPRR